jgi:hypothetical protein
MPTLINVKVGMRPIFHILGLLVGFQLLQIPLLANQPCAVTVRVVGTGGEAVNFTQIQLIDPSGRIVLNEIMQESEYKICDFGFGVHTLRVGANECLPVSISNLRVDLAHPLYLTVVLNTCSYRVMRSACRAYFRTVDDAGKPIAGVAFSPALSDLPQVTDQYGRWQGLFKGTKLLQFSKSGYVSRSAMIKCIDNEEVDAEIVLKNKLP